MGTYLNPGAGKLRQSCNSEIYVDKSGMLSYLNHVINTEQRFVCVSRPRRFGKSMSANLISAYYDIMLMAEHCFTVWKLKVIKVLRSMLVIMT